MKYSFLLIFFPVLVAFPQEQPRVQVFQSPIYQKIEIAGLTRDFQTVFACDTMGYVLLWRIHDGSIAKILRAHNKAITQIELSPDGVYMATTSRDNSVFTWELNTGRKISEIQLARTPAIAFNRSGYLLFNIGNVIYRAPISDLAMTEVIFKADNNISTGASVEDGKYFAISLKEQLLLLDASNGKEIARANTCAGVVSIQGMANHILCRCSDGFAQLFELNQTALQKLNERIISTTPSSKFLLLPEQKNVLFTSASGSVKIWDLVTNQLFDTEELQEPVTALGTAGEYILTGNKNGEVFIRKTPFARGEIDIKPVASAATAPVKLANERQIRFQEPVEVQLQELDIYVWDDENIDGDTISLSLNGEWILEKYMVTKEKKKLTLHLTPEKKNTLVLYAENLGKAPPNTAVISFHDGNKERTLTLNSDLKRSDAVNFILK